MKIKMESPQFSDMPKDEGDENESSDHEGESRRQS
jgi:hypothetical protein